MLGTQDAATVILPYKPEEVFEATSQVAQKMKGFKIKSADKLLGRIVLTASASASSWGEAIPIQLNETEGGKTQISISSKSQTGILGGGAFTKKNEQNVEVLLNNVSNQLQGKGSSISSGGSSKSALATIFICLFFGWMGGHRFYVGKTKSGLLYLFTFGVFTLGWIFDTFRIILGNFTDKNGDYVSNW